MAAKKKTATKKKATTKKKTATKKKVAPKRKTTIRKMTKKVRRRSHFPTEKKHQPDPMYDAGTITGGYRVMSGDMHGGTGKKTDPEGHTEEELKELRYQHRHVEWARKEPLRLEARKRQRLRAKRAAANKKGKRVSPIKRRKTTTKK